MPYAIHPYRNGFRVYSIHGTPLSKKPLDWDKAHAQLEAVNKTYGRFERMSRRRRGGNATGILENDRHYTKQDGEEDEASRSYPLSDSDILAILPDLKT